MKHQVCLNIDGNVWELAKLRFPNQLSQYVESYFKTLLELDEVENPAEREETELNKLNEKLETLKRRKQILQEKQKLRESEITKKEEERIEKDHEVFLRTNPLRYL